MKRTLLGMLTPSSNTVLEPIASEMVAELPDVSVHFGRFRVTEISFSENALGQFDFAPMLQAAELLADARVQVICWNGTSAGWLGLDKDRALCAAITKHTGIPACSSVLALAEIFRLTGVTRYGLVTPYLNDIQDKIVVNFRAEGFDCAAERHLNDRGNFSFSEVREEAIVDMVRAVAKVQPQAVSIFCTNLRGAPVVERLEKEIAIPIYDTVATGIWAALRVAGVDPSGIRNWGRLFREVR